MQVLSKMDTILPEIDQRIHAQETTSYNGIFIWKIPDYKKHVEKARSDRQFSIYSSPFYTSRHGYKLSALMYLLGDGVGRDSHISLYVMLRKGQYDSLLNWPFRQKVTFTLMDQSVKKDHISDTFLPADDPESSPFERPLSEMNTAAGCRKFVELDVLRSPEQTYVKDDTLYIRIAVDTSGILNY